MPGVAVQALGSPFRQLPRLEFTYGEASAEALDPIAPLLDDTVYDNRGLVVVADIYSVWPQVGAFPGSETYEEVLGKLNDYLRRECGIRLTPRLCRRVVYRAIPWRGLMGGWRFTATPADALAHAIYEILGLADSASRITSVYVVLDDDGDAALKLITLEAARYAALAWRAKLYILASEPRPYPVPRRGATVELIEVDSVRAETLAAQAAAEPPAYNPLLKPVTPKAKTVQLKKTETYTIISHAMAWKSLLLPLAYSACGAQDPLQKLKTILEKHLAMYREASELSKKPVGGILRHHLAFSPHSLRSLLAGAALEAHTLKVLVQTEGQDPCTKLYSEGLKEETLEALEKIFMKTDRTPHECIEPPTPGRLKLRKGCLNQIRRELEEALKKTKPGEA